MRNTSAEVDRRVNKAMMVGVQAGDPDFAEADSTNNPGLLTDAQTAITLAGKDAITFDELVDAHISIGEEYFAQSLVWMMRLATQGLLWKLKDSQERPVFIEGSLASGIPPSVLGYPVVLDSNLDTAVSSAASQNIAVFGAVQYGFLIRQSQMRLNIYDDSQYSSRGKIGYSSSRFNGGRMIDVGGGARRIVTAA